LNTRNLRLSQLDVYRKKSPVSRLIVSTASPQIAASRVGRRRVARLTAAKLLPQRLPSKNVSALEFQAHAEIDVHRARDVIAVDAVGQVHVVPGASNESGTTADPARNLASKRVSLSVRVRRTHRKNRVVPSGWTF
jgi:hypothetical protein